MDLQAGNRQKLNFTGIESNKKKKKASCHTVIRRKKQHVYFGSGIRILNNLAKIKKGLCEKPDYFHISHSIIKKKKGNHHLKNLAL